MKKNILVFSVLFLFSFSSWGSMTKGRLPSEILETYNPKSPLGFSYILNIDTLNPAPNEEEIENYFSAHPENTLEDTYEFARMGDLNSILSLGERAFEEGKIIESLKYYFWAFQKYWLETGEHHEVAKEKILSSVKHITKEKERTVKKTSRRQRGKGKSRNNNSRGTSNALPQLEFKEGFGPSERKEKRDLLNFFMRLEKGSTKNKAFFYFYPEQEHTNLDVLTKLEQYCSEPYLNVSERALKKNHFSYYRLSQFNEEDLFIIEAPEDEKHLALWVGACKGFPDFQDQFSRQILHVKIGKGLGKRYTKESYQWLLSAYQAGYKQEEIEQRFLKTYFDFYGFSPIGDPDFAFNLLKKYASLEYPEHMRTLASVYTSGSEFYGIAQKRESLRSSGMKNVRTSETQMQ